MMSRTCGLLFLVLATLWAGKHDKKVIGQAENAVVEITAAALADPESIQRAIGANLDNHYILVEVHLRPKSGTLPIHLDDFMLKTDKDGERTTPFQPVQMVGSGAMVVSEKSIGGMNMGTQNNGPVWGGMPGTMGRPRQLPGNAQGIGNSASPTEAQAKMSTEPKDKKDDPMLAVLKEKMLPEKETDQPVSGLLYFPMEKQKLKDLELIYTTPAGKLNL